MGKTDVCENDEFEQFHSKLQSVFEFLRYSGEKEQMKKKLQEHREQYEGLSSEAKILLSKLTSIKKIPCRRAFGGSVFTSL